MGFLYIIFYVGFSVVYCLRDPVLLLHIAVFY